MSRTARIEGSKAKGLIARIAYFFARRELGNVPLPMRIAAHHRPLFTGMMQMEFAHRRSATLSARMKYLVQLLVAKRIGCPF